MTFREALANDLSGVIFNEDEAAEWHDIDGNQYLVIVDDDALTKRQLKAGHEAGVFDGTLLFFVRASDMPMPSVDQPMRFDNKVYRVLSASEQDGMFTITLKSTRAR